MCLQFQHVIFEKKSHARRNLTTQCVKPLPIRNILQPTAAASGPPRVPTSQTSSAAPPAAAVATGGAAVNLVLWEDWPRKVQEKRDGAEEDR